MLSLPIPTLCDNPARDYWTCGCPATFGDPSEFCPDCQADWEAWLDALYFERQCEERGPIL